jgi:hypothetical protein
MQAIEPATARPRSSRRKRIALLCVAAVAVALLIGLGVKIWLDHRVPPPDGDPSRVARYMASPAFAALPKPQQQPYLEAFQHASQDGSVTPQQQQGVIRNVFHGGPGNGPIQAYFKLPPGKARQQFLDNVIDNQRKLEKDGGMRPAPPGGKGIRIAGQAPIPPEDRAQMDQFMQDLHDRRQARGLPDDGRVLFTVTH